MNDISFPLNKLKELESLESAIQDPERIYLPHVRPQHKVDYIFIGTEPSLGKWANTIEIANAKIKDGFRNFIFSVEDFIMLYAIEHYLTKSYYITDISKFAVPIRDANKKYWLEGLPVLLKELEVYEHDKTKIISIGNSQVKFLRQNNIIPYSVLLHFSSQNSHRRKHYAQVEYKEQYEKFLKIMPNIEDIREFAKRYLDNLRKSISITEDMKVYLLSNLARVKELSLAKKELLFYYYNNFTYSSEIINRKESNSAADEIVQMMINNLNGL